MTSKDNKVICMNWLSNKVTLVAEPDIMFYHEPLCDLVPKNLRDICSGIKYQVNQHNGIKVKA